MTMVRVKKIGAYDSAASGFKNTKIDLKVTVAGVVRRLFAFARFLTGV